MKKTYILIDYENVQPDAMAALEREHFHVFVFVGASQAKVTYDVASVLQPMGDRAVYIKIAGNGSNALDFHIAYFIGLLSAKEPDANFHIVSKDTGFDPLLQYLKSKKIAASRVKSVSDIPSLNAAAKLTPDPVSIVIANLAKSGAAKPRTLVTLARAIHALFQKSLSETEVQHIIVELKKKGVVVTNQAKVSYVLPTKL